MTTTRLHAIRLRATYATYLWESDEPDTEPTITHGYTSVGNPWGGLDAEVPEGLCGPDFTVWRDENAETVTVDILEAARIVADFPGGVWDYREGNGAETVDYGTGETREVTLHVEDHAETVFALADAITAGSL